MLFCSTAYTAPVRIGTTTFAFTDSRREEPWTIDAADSRKLVVQIWYPAPLGRGLKVIVFSHGMNSTRTRYTGYFEDLARRGFVVAAVEHTYWNAGAGMSERTELTSDEIDEMMAAGVEVMAADDAFVVEKLRELAAGHPRGNVLEGHLDLRRVGIFGHSMGGRAATRACLDSTAFAACLSLDGPLYSMHLQPAPMAKPFLLLLNAESGPKAAERIARTYLAAWAAPTVAIIRGSRHNTFSDASDDPRARATIGSIVAAFFETHLGGHATVVEDPSIEYVDLHRNKHDDGS